MEEVESAAKSANASDFIVSMPQAEKVTETPILNQLAVAQDP